MNIFQYGSSFQNMPRISKFRFEGTSCSEKGALLPQS